MDVSYLAIMATFAKISNNRQCCLRLVLYLFPYLSLNLVKMKEMCANVTLCNKNVRILSSLYDPSRD